MRKGVTHSVTPFQLFAIHSGLCRFTHMPTGYIHTAQRLP